MFIMKTFFSSLESVAALWVEGAREGERGLAGISSV
jgi:hypothetical protein